MNENFIFNFILIITSFSPRWTYL